MTNLELLQKVLAERREIQARNEQEEQRREREASEKNPEIGRLIDERRRAIFAGLRQALDGVIPFGIEQDTLRRNARIEQLLTQSGFPADYLAPIYDCTLCEDTGYTGDGQKTLCACATRRYQQLLTDEAFRDETQTFENYDERLIPADPLPGKGVSQRAYTRLLREQCEAYANALPHGQVRSLLLYGGSGLGKTFLLRAIGVRASERGVHTLALTANTLLNRIRAQYFARGGEQMDDSHMHVPLLLIDDLGTEPLWEGITVEQLFALIDHRQRMGLNTVISTNLSLTELKSRYTERLTSRLLDEREYQTLAFHGEDLRQRR